MSNIYGVSSTSTRFTGMMSGIDTDEVVQTMTAGTAGQLAKLQQSKALLEYKAAAYQGVSSKMINFSNTYLSYSSSLNALSSSFFNARSVSSSSKAVSVSGYSASAANLSIRNIQSYAVNASFVTRQPAASSSITMKGIDFSAAGKTVNNIQGEYLTVSYGGNEYAVRIDPDAPCTTNAEVVAALNDALDEVDIGGGKTLKDVIKVQLDGTPANNIEISMQDPANDNLFIISEGSGNLLKALGITIGTNNMTGQGTAPITCGIDPLELTSQVKFNDTAAGETISFSYNGTVKSIKLPTYDANFADNLQKEFDKAFGEKRINVTVGADSITLTPQKWDDGTNAYVTDDTAVLSIASASSALVGAKTATNIVVGTTNRLSLDTKLEDLNLGVTPSVGLSGEFEIDVNGVPLSFTKDQTLRDVLEAINTSDANVYVEYLSTTNSFSVRSTMPGAAGKVDIKDTDGTLIKSLFGEKDNGLSGAQNNGGYHITAGSDAVIEVSYDGGQSSTFITRSTNTFDIDGLTVTLNAAAKHDFSVDGAITFEVQTNADDMVEKIKTLIDAFNEINDLVTKELTTKYDREYPPLTAAQRAELSESEIKLWDEKSKEGLLFNDPTIRNLSIDLRAIFSGAVSGVGFARDFGISVSSNWEDYGKIVIDEEALRKAIEERPDEVTALFTSEDGIMPRIKEVFDTYAATTGKNKGKLITIAGIEGGSVLIKDTQISKQIEVLEKSIEHTQRSLKMQTDRYNKRFTALEVYIAKMSAQSSWLADYFT